MGCMCSCKCPGKAQTIKQGFMGLPPDTILVSGGEFSDLLSFGNLFLDGKLNFRSDTYFLLIIIILGVVITFILIPADFITFPKVTNLHTQIPVQKGQSSQQSVPGPYNSQSV